MNVVSLLAKLPKERLHQYTEVRDYLMREFKLTAEQYRDKFRAAIKRPEQTYSFWQLSEKSLFVLLRYYRSYDRRSGRRTFSVW